MTALYLLLPDFSLVALGLLLRRHTSLGDHFWSDLEKLVYYVLFPALLISAISRATLEFEVAGPMLQAGLGAMAAGMLLGALVGPLFGLSPVVAASVNQCAFRFNSYIGLAVVGKLYGADGIAAMGLIIGLAVPFANLVAVWWLARSGAKGVFRELLRNPLILSTLFGLALNFLGLSLPSPVAAFSDRLSDASIALGLLAVGAALKLNGYGRGWASAYLLGVKLFVMPLVALSLGLWLGLHGLSLHVAVVFAALPTASSAYILTARMGGDGASVAWLISVSTLLAGGSLAFWLSWLGRVQN